MRLLGKQIDKDGCGEVKMIPEEPEDMWHAYNLIAVGDRIRATTIRKVKSETATGSTDSQRVRTTLCISVLDVEFDTEACKLRIKGRNVEENQYVKMGAHHTIDMELNRKFTLIKAEWDSVALERLDQACDVTKSADLAAVAMQEGLANICLVTTNMTLLRSRIELSIPRKRRGDNSQHEKAMKRFFDQVIESLLRHINFDGWEQEVDCDIWDQFLEYMFAQAVKTDNKTILENKALFIGVHASSGHKHALNEVLSDPAVASRLADTKAAGEINALNNFFAMLRDNPDRAFYGLRHVEYANENQAIETLMVTDALFRSKDLRERKRYVGLVDSVRDNGGDVRIFSSLHVSGENLAQLSGVAAILRFPLPELEDSDDSDDSENEDEADGDQGSDGAIDDGDDDGDDSAAAAAGTS